VNSTYDLLDKKELRVSDVHLDGANLSELARLTAGVLGLPAEEVLVTDYLDEVLTFDVLRPALYPHQLLNRQDLLLSTLATATGVRLGSRARVSANGVLGWIAAGGADAEQIQQALRDAETAAAQISDRVARRAIVFSTGQELLTGQVQDTNRETILQALAGAGYSATFGGTLRDDAELITGSIRTAVERGHGLVITTGGVGAEAKDHTIDAVLRLDPAAPAPYLATFTPGHGRHVRDGVRITVATYQGARIVCLPGPNDEVRVGLAALLPGLAAGWPDDRLADTVAQRLREILRARMAARHPRAGEP